MKHLWKVSAIVFAIPFAAACGGAGDDAGDSADIDPPSSELAANPGSTPVSIEPSATASGRQAEETDGANASSAPSEDAVSKEAGADISILGKTCFATCSVVNLGGMCPVTISGFGQTTFLGGCSKACRKAEGDASSKLPSGCLVDKCDFSGC